MLNTVLYAVMNSICCEFLCGWLCFASHCQTSAPNRVALRLYRSSPEPLALRCTTSAPSCLALRCSPPGTQHPIGRQSERGRPQRQGVWHGDAAPPPTRATYHLSGGGGCANQMALEWPTSAPMHLALRLPMSADTGTPKETAVRTSTPTWLALRRFISAPSHLVLSPGSRCGDSFRLEPNLK